MKPRDPVAEISMAKIRLWQKQAQATTIMEDDVWIELMNFAKLGYIVSSGIAGMMQDEAEELGVKFGDIDGSTPNS